MQPVKTIAALLLLAWCGQGQIAGTVRDSASGLPVAGVKILVTGARAQEVQTRETGTFSLDPVPPGRYMVFFRRDNYEDGHATVEVKPGGATVALEIRPFAEMEGVVRDEDGEPLEGVSVYVGGLRDSTDKAGHFHAQDIAGGQYTVTLRLPFELRRKAAIRDVERGQTFGYGYTLYYPGVTDPKLASPVTLAPGTRFTNFDIQLKRSPLVEMKGRIPDAPDNAEVELDSSRGLPDGPYNKRKLDAHGGFHFALLEPGDYTLVVHRNRPGDDLPYLSPVHLSDTGVQDLQVVLPLFARIEGAVRTLRADLRWEGVLRVMLGRLGFDTEVRVGTDGRFALNAIPPGEWNLAIDTSLTYRAGDARRRMYLNTQPPALLNVTEGGNAPLDLVLTDTTGRITGRADEPGLVTAFQAGVSRLSRFAMPGADGTFEIEVPPGEYEIGLTGGADCAKAKQKVSVTGGASVSVHLKACGADQN